MKKIIENMERQVGQIPALEMERSSWVYEEGVLLTGKEAQEIIDFFGQIEHIINSGERNKLRSIERLLEQD